MAILQQQLKTFTQLFCARFEKNKLSQAAGYLTYSTMLAFVPLILVVFSIFSAFPVFNELTMELKTFIFTNFAPDIGDTVGKYLDQFVSNAKQMSVVGVVGLIVVALLLIHSIDTTLNSIWQNTDERPLISSFAIYWVILTLGPVIIAISLAVSQYVSNFASSMLNTESSSFLGLELLKIVPFFLTWFIFTLIYLIVPNTKVRAVDSCAGALIAAVFFTLGKQIFGWYITTFPSYHLIYGAMATLPILLVWIQLSWLAILLGAQLSAVLGEMNTLKNKNMIEQEIKEKI